MLDRNIIAVVRRRVHRHRPRARLHLQLPLGLRRLVQQRHFRARHPRRRRRSVVDPWKAGLRRWADWRLSKAWSLRWADWRLWKARPLRSAD